MKQNFFTELITSKSGKSSNRFLMLVFGFVLILFGAGLFVIEIKDNNIELLKTIINGFVTIILGVSGISLVAKFNKVDKKENTDENNS